MEALLGRPPGLPLTPGLKLVDRSPPFGIASVCLFFCLFSAIIVLAGSSGTSVIQRDEYTSLARPYDSSLTCVIGRLVQG